MHVAVIGAGAAGLCALKHLTARDSGFTCVAYEQTDSIGGTWVYTEKIGTDKYEMPICSSMYKNLRTNLATANMEFPGFPFISAKSFVSVAEVLQYLEDYSTNYDLKRHIQFLHHVKQVTPKDNKWDITALHLPTGNESTVEFDAVIVCNGHNTVPDVGGFDLNCEFEGEMIHSHSYRSPEPYAGQVVLVVGGGPSGIDITYDLANFASKVYFSHKSTFKPGSFPENVEEVTVVDSVQKNHVVLCDGSTKFINSIIICTGYKYSFPFLDQKCGISVECDKFVQPLYKHLININNPTMAFIGLLFKTFLFPLFDYQVCFFLKTLNGEIELITKENMKADLEDDIENKKKRGIPFEKYHKISDELKEYLDELAKQSKVKPLPPVLFDIYKATSNLRKENLANYREFIFRAEDDFHFKMLSPKTI